MEGQVARAREIAAEYLEGLARGNGHAFLEHPDKVAAIVRDEIGLTSECETAVYLHEASRMHPEILPSIREEFGPDIATMVEGLNNISRINPKDTRLEAENYKKLIVNYSKDPRVAVIKIADRLEVMRSLDLFPKASREKKSLESLLLYIPIAHQLGLYNIKSEMEDIYFKYADPDGYRAITNKLKAGERDREKLMREFIGPLKARLEAEGVSYKLKVRTKAAYSIWKKMQVQKVPFEGVYDVFAIRFIIDSPDDRDSEKALCWKVFSLVTEEYESDTNRLRDWISNPKANGYESLHITVKNRDGAYLEVQIRTRRMDEIAESGLASHWSYKGIKKEATLDMWLNSVRSLLEKKNTLESVRDSAAVLNNDVFVFTPSGELRKLPFGASVLDFAFEIHSGLGLKCTGGLVNGKAVPIREKLHTGDYVEIIKGKNQKPSADWLNYVVTSKARSKIKLFLKEEEYQRSNEGKELLASKCRKWKFEVSDEDLAALMKRYRQKTLNSFYEAVGDGRIDPLDIKKFVEFRHEAHHIDIQEPVAADAAPEGAGRSGDASGVLIIDAKHIKNMDYKLAACCHPTFGDDIFGFVTRFDGIKIHRISCPNAARLLDQYPYRILKAKWGK
ncbi:MAG: HD domain-containing protein [Bacteroidales bacterium]|nr:HD domain-containing protein [Bacteroidales bacterium]